MRQEHKIKRLSASEGPQAAVGAHIQPSQRTTLCPVVWNTWKSPITAASKDGRALMGGPQHMSKLELDGDC